MLSIIERIATLAAALFAGAALYVNLVEHPARMTLDPACAVAEFAPSYARATIMQASLAIVGLVAGVVAWLLGAPLGWLIGGCLLGAVVPFTILVIFPTNKALLAEGAASDARRLLVRWNRLHTVRTVLSLVALLLFLMPR